MSPARDRNTIITLTILVAIGVIGAGVATLGFLWPLVQAKASWPLLLLGLSCMVALLIGLGRSFFLAGYHRGSRSSTDDKDF
ncbi:hypothetical protein [Xanthomonas sacchari]|uniref:hypothetical protein n=1 Tax=Xanthomonas sacchari TaxID=56458 RepID=UPI00225E3E61|nr:hypothetical protein [Xanthomonas sacchari]